jgi:hypothetical protein
MSIAADPPPQPEGWAWLFNARKWHYFVAEKSLCGKWMTLGRSREQGNDDSPDNCAGCRKVLKSRQERLGDNH